MDPETQGAYEVLGYLYASDPELVKRVCVECGAFALLKRLKEIYGAIEQDEHLGRS